MLCILESYFIAYTMKQRNNNYASGRLQVHPYLKDGFVFDFEIRQSKALIKNGKKVKV